MKLVVDTNIVISGLLHRRRIHDLLFYRQDLELYAPRLLFEELGGHSGKISRLTTLTPRETQVLVNRILPKRINVVPEETYREKLTRALEILGDVDLGDAPFVALAMFLGVPLWTGDKGLLVLSAETGEYIAVDTEGVELLLSGEPLDNVLERMRRKYLK